MKRIATIIVLSAGLIAGPAMADHNGRHLLSQEHVGGAIGAAVGGFVGSQFGDGKARLATTAAGAVGGFLLGEQIAHNYHGRSHRGSRYDKYPRRHEHRSRHRVRLYPIHDTYVARTTSNVRAGPSTRYWVIDQLYRHERVRVIGKVKGRHWYMIRTGGQRGFVYAPLLRKPYRNYGHADHHDGQRSSRAPWYR